MKKGMTIMIFRDPITQNKKEGAAKLIRKLAVRYNRTYKLETWKVRFTGGHANHNDDSKNKTLVLRTCVRTIREDLKDVKPNKKMHRVTPAMGHLMTC